MPYIESKLRDGIAGAPLCGVKLLHPGELNYAVSILCYRYLSEHGMNYECMNAIVGALESAKAEFQRRVVAPYEDTKMRLNGDITP